MATRAFITPPQSVESETTTGAEASAHRPDADDLAPVGFTVRGIAETLRAFATSEAARGLRDALDVLAEAAERSAAAIADFVEHDLEAKKIADAARGAA